MDDSELVEELRRAAAGERRWSNFFWWHDRSDAGKGIAECGATRDLFAALRESGGPEYSTPRRSGDQWPDCEAENSAGQTIAIEVTELVDSKSLSPGGQPQPWSEERLIAAIQHRVDAKDARAFHGEKYAEVILLIHTDEFYLELPATIRVLEAVTFERPHGNLSSAYLLFSYWPEVGHCPAAELRLK